MKHQHGLAVMRCQPFHIGHDRLIHQMLDECETVTICLGSIQEAGTKRNPFSYSQRQQLLDNRFSPNPNWWDKVLVMGLVDISNDADWPSYVLNAVRLRGRAVCNRDRKEVDAYYCGSEYDGSWFKASGLAIELVDRTFTGVPFCSATMIREMCLYNDERWKLYIHPENHTLVQSVLCVERPALSVPSSEVDNVLGH